MSDEIERLRLTWKRLSEEANAALNAYHDAMCAAHHIQPGDILRSSDGQIARVSGLNIKYDKVHIVAHLQKKDGTIGLREAPLWRREWKHALWKKESGQ